MTMSDPIADMLTRIRNANTAKHDTVDVPASKMKIAIADVLLKEGYIAKYDIVEEGKDRIVVHTYREVPMQEKKQYIFLFKKGKWLLDSKKRYSSWKQKWLSVSL